MSYFIQAKTHQGFFEFSQLQASKEYAEERVTALAMGGEYAAVRWVNLGANGDITQAGDWNGFRLGDSARPRDDGPHAAAKLTRELDLLQSEITVYKSQVESLKASQSATQELLRELDLLRNEVATYRECGIIRMQTLAALISDQAKEIENIDAGEKARR